MQNKQYADFGRSIFDNANFLGPTRYRPNMSGVESNAYTMVKSYWWVGIIPVAFLAFKFMKK